ncbi:TadE/TadG family type IV pilus assembly protein [Roseicyclus sp.]|uniref:TadE/TadG family type IV pilus assembly protein n=1 Tax=Roseicyclus sp. TaxID=1914329 RepID=UPI003F9F3D2C
MLNRVKHFLRDSGAAVALETVLIIPILIWSFVASFVFFDAYRVYSTSVKATYMVADMLSRQTNDVIPHDIEGMANVIDSIIRGAGAVQMRATQVGVINDAYVVEWSHAVNGAARLFTSNIPDIRDRLPNMPNGERIVLVETFVGYEAPFNIGLTVLRFDNFTVVRPRYAGQVPFNPDGVPPST